MTGTTAAQPLCTTPGDAAPATTPEIGVIVPHLNQPALLGKCLAKLAAQNIAPGRFEVIVVDNGSSAPPDAVVAAFPGVRLEHEVEPGPGPARNRGVACSRAPILAFTDADCLPEPDWLATILTHFAAHPETGAVGGDIRITISEPGRPSMAEAFEMIYAFRQRSNITRHRFSATANLAVRREVFEAVGPFAGLEMSEDLDWGQRGAEMGLATRYLPAALVFHPARRTMADLRAQWDRHVSHFYRQRAEDGGRLRWAMTIPLMAASPLAELPTVLTTRKVPDLRSRALAFLGLVRIRLFRARRMTQVLIDDAARGGNTAWNRR